MAQVYLFADPHFGHLNMAKRRGFNTVEEHDNYIIERWNSTVRKNDKVYLLGDITMESNKSYHLLKKLKGNIIVVGGNHDKPGHAKEMLKYISGFSGAIKYEEFILTHFPIHEGELNDKRFLGNIHGHVHKNILSDNRYFCVSAEAVNYTPISFECIKEKFKREVSGEVGDISM
jgi:calcineurin-like phosphoesterase family protein